MTDVDALVACTRHLPVQRARKRPDSHGNLRNRRRLAVAASVFSHWMPSFRTHLRIGAGLFSSFIGGIRLTLTGLRTRMEWGHSKWTHLRSDWYCTQPGRVPGHARHNVGPRAARVACAPRRRASGARVRHMRSNGQWGLNGQWGSASEKKTSRLGFGGKHQG